MMRIVLDGRREVVSTRPSRKDAATNHHSHAQELEAQRAALLEVDRGQRHLVAAAEEDAQEVEHSDGARVALGARHRGVHDEDFQSRGPAREPPGPGRVEVRVGGVRRPAPQGHGEGLVLEDLCFFVFVCLCACVFCVLCFASCVVEVKTMSRTH